MESGKTMNYKKVLFTDLDGTIITTLSGKEFPNGCYDMKFRFEVLNAIKNYNPDLVVIVSNQGGIEAGFVNPNFFKNKIMWVSSVIAEYCHCDCRIEYCPKVDKYDRRRKPNSGMIFDVQATIINTPSYFMIGDRKEDEECAAGAEVPYSNVEDFVNLYHGWGPVSGA